MTNKLFNIDHLKHLCQKYGLWPSKKYGQNFLVDEDVIEQIVQTAKIKKTDTIVEIGPGFGTLTFALSKLAKNVIAFEIEKKLDEYWNEKIKQFPNINIEWGNVLKNLNKLPNKKYKVVANLPYQITSHVIRAFLEAKNPPIEMILMVQKEVAERICAKPGEMSVLSVSVQYYSEPSIVGIIPRDNFWPEPKVDSAIMKLSLRAPAGGVAIPRISELNRDKDCRVSAIRRILAMTSGQEKLFSLVKAGFANRRKLLIKNLQAIIGKKNKEKIKQVFVELNLKETVRAQELSVEQWTLLSEKLF